MNPFLLLFALALVVFWIWVDVLLYRWVKRRWPTLATVLLVLWWGNLAWVLYRFVTSRRQTTLPDDV